MNKQQWVTRLRELHDACNSRHFDLGDAVNDGIRNFGREAAFAAVATIAPKNKRNFFTRCAVVSSFYPASLRFPSLNFHTYEILMRFGLPFCERFISSIADSGRSAAQIYSLACERHGSDPRRKKNLGKTHSVKLPEKLFHALAVRASSPDKTHLLVVKILSEWEQQQGVGKASVPDPEARENDVPSIPAQPKAGAEESTLKRMFRERDPAPENWTI